MSLEDKKSESRQKEINQIKLLSKYLENERKNFDYADTSHWILQDKNESDLILISEKLNEWHSKAKDENKKQFLELIITVFRVQSYCTTIETIAKGSVAKYSNEYKRNLQLESELSTTKNELILLKTKYENEIKKLKEQIGFGT
jgi:hypothetical protein